MAALQSSLLYSKCREVRQDTVREWDSPPPDSSHMASRQTAQLFAVLAETQSPGNLLLLLLPCQ